MERNHMKHLLSRISSQVSHGFTLLELLVVIAIIGILISVGTASYSSAQKKSRDARRTSDMKVMQAGFEQYYADNTAYPTSASCTLSATYLPAGMPVDPKNTSPYVYTVTCTDGSTYCACGRLEGTTTGGNATATNCTFGAGNYFCVKNLQ